jgi:hypothetical protein
MSREWIIGGIATLIAIITLLYTTLPGDVKPLEPSSFAIIQGIGNFQSDHIIVPIEWVNHGGQQALVRPTQLTLTNNRTRLIFVLAGEFVGRSSNEPGHMGEYYILKQAFVVAPHAITPTTMVFHIKDWYTDKNRTRGSAFTFKNNTSTSEDHYDVSIDFSYVSYLDILGRHLDQSASEKNIPLFRLYARNWTRLLNYNDYRWDASSTDLNIQNKSFWPFRK